MPFVLYTMSEAAEWFKHEAHLSYREETIRNRLKAAKLTIHKVSKLDLVAEEDLKRLKDMPEPKRGRPRKTAIVK